MQALYGPERRFDYTALTPALRVRLSQQVFGRGDVRGAAEPVLDLDEPPAGQPQLDWELRRARLQLFAGDFTGGERRLLALLDRVPVLAEQDADRAVQLAFDLQTVDRHESALRVLERLLARTDSPRQHRELLLWMAESREALAHHADAAELFLRSAMVAADGLDSWGRAARLRAAEALRTAGLLDDARLLYEGLLQATSDPRERARIGHALQSLSVARAAKEPS